MNNLQEKALDCLHLCSLPTYSPERIATYTQLARAYSPKAVNKKIKELIKRGYLERVGDEEHFGNVVLTTKGREALDLAQAARRVS